MGHRFTFIEPSRPALASTRDTLVASLAATVVAPCDNIELASAIGDAIARADDATGALIDADSDYDAAPARAAIRRAALTMLALLAAYEART